MIPQRDGLQETLQVARYVTKMAIQLEKMAASVRLDALAYFLGMAKSEGDLVVSRMAKLEKSGDSERIEPDDAQTNDDKPL